MISLFTMFFRIGLFTFGGGYAAYPLILDGLLTRGWMSEAQFADIWGVCNMLPGAVAVNTAAFVGYRTHGVSGALAAAFGAILPSLSLVIIATYFIARVNKSRILKGAFYGLRPAASGLIMAAAFRMAWATFFPKAGLLEFAKIADGVSIFAVALFAAAFLVMLKVKIKNKPVNPILVIIGAAATGIVCGSAGLL
ncbi:MAG: chromate transporter [Defluviitaleaceae bacterium]|nr:chromate transporter [Defluviitaleaceae bacterium]MCL2837288.1 chromate transporter [Defluviitaleaceae bacterium]